VIENDYIADDAGTFNPYLNFDEEPGLCLRIRHAGYRVLLLDCPIVRHYTDRARRPSPGCRAGGSRNSFGEWGKAGLGGTRFQVCTGFARAGLTGSVTP
jgi:hypothetical protein